MRARGGAEAKTPLCTAVQPRSDGGAPAAPDSGDDRLRLALEVATEGFWDLDVATGLIYGSPGCARLLGLGEEELPAVWERWLDLAHPEDREQLSAAFDACRRGEARALEVEARLRASDGSWRWVLARGKAVARDHDGRALRIVGTHVDVTERRRLEEENRKLEAQLFQARKMESVGRLAGGVAHDFNNMLSVILGRADLVARLLPPADPLRSDVAEILSAAERSSELTRQLLSFARQQVATPEIVDLNYAISGMLKMLRRLIGEHIELVWSPGEDVWRVRIDPVQVDQIVANLVVNARDAISGAGALTLTTENAIVGPGVAAAPADLPPGEYAVLSVRDTGAGMTEEVLARVFDPFFTTKAPGRGTGLGLSTVNGVVRQNRGGIAVESVPGRGSTFRVYLPRCEAEAPVQKAAAPQSVVRGTETILVVEDDASTLRVAQAMLEWAGYKVLASHNPDNALLLAAKYPGPIALLLTDVIMPQMSGREVAKRLQKSRPGVKCLYMSGYTADVIARQGILDEGVSFLTKPLKVESLTRAVRAVLDEPKEGET